VSDFRHPLAANEQFFRAFFIKSVFNPQILTFFFGMFLGSASTKSSKKLYIMISLKNIDKFYENKFQRAFVLKDVSLDIEQGEFVTIMGPSGAGKSTVLNIIGLLDEPSAGEYYFMDEPVHKLRERQKSEIHKHQIGFVFQAYHLIDELTVYENIETPLLYKGVKSKERKSMVAEMLDRFQIVAKKDLFPDQLSGGQQQLVGVARAIVGRPKLLLADEPTGNLHSEQGDEIMQLFKKLNDEGMTIIQVTHSEKNAQYGDRIIRLVDGIVRSDTKVAQMHV
jgi:ABC-type lipoprotein export system ATPase subunit